MTYDVIRSAPQQRVWNTGGGLVDPNTGAQTLPGGFNPMATGQGQGQQRWTGTPEQLQQYMAQVQAQNQQYASNPLGLPPIPGNAGGGGIGAQPIGGPLPYDPRNPGNGPAPTAPTRMTWGQAQYTPDGQLILPSSGGNPYGGGMTPGAGPGAGDPGMGGPQPVGGGIGFPRVPNPIPAWTPDPTYQPMHIPAPGNPGGGGSVWGQQGQGLIQGMEDLPYDPSNPGNAGGGMTAGQGGQGENIGGGIAQGGTNTTTPATYGGANQPWGAGITPNASNPYAYQGVGVRWNPQINPSTGQPYGYEEITTGQQQAWAGITGYDVNGNPTFANRQWQTDISGMTPAGQATVANQQAYAQMYGTGGAFGTAGEGAGGIGGTGLTLTAQQQQWSQQFQQQQADIQQRIAYLTQTGQGVDPTTGESIQTLQYQAQQLAAQAQEFGQGMATTQEARAAQQQQFTQQLQTTQQALARAQQNGQMTGQYVDPETGQSMQTLQSQQQQFTQALATTQEQRAAQAQEFGQGMQTQQAQFQQQQADIANALARAQQSGNFIDPVTGQSVQTLQSQQQQFSQGLQTQQQTQSEQQQAWAQQFQTQQAETASALQRAQMSGTMRDPVTGETVQTLQARAQTQAEEQQRFSQGLATSQEARAAQQQQWGQTFQTEQAQNQLALDRAKQSGNLIDPQTGQSVQTLEAKQQQFAQGISAAGLTGTYNGTTTLAGRQQTLAEQQAAQDWQYKQAMMAANPANYAVSAALQGRAPWQAGVLGGNQTTGARATPNQTTGATTTQQAQATPSTPGTSAWGVPTARQMNAATYTGMNPDERSAFNSAVAASGQSAEDYQERMRRVSPQQQGRTVATFRG